MWNDNSDQFLIGEFLNGIEASLNAVGSGSPVLGKEDGSDVCTAYGPVRANRDAAVSPGAQSVLAG